MNYNRIHLRERGFKPKLYRQHRRFRIEIFELSLSTSLPAKPISCWKPTSWENNSKDWTCWSQSEIK